jgi:DNA polymerase III gamma/tau subunit
MNCSSNRGVDDVRGIAATMGLAPTGGPVRVYLMDESHQLTTEAQNAALKMLEDTPEHVYFLLCTTEPKKLKKTIRTRCSDMPVELLDYGCMKKLVEDVSQKERITADDDVIDALCDFAEGSPRMALVGLDKIRHIEDPHEQINTLNQAEAESETRPLCQALLKRKSWRTVAGILKGLTAEPESIRWAVLGYMKAVLLNSGNEQAFRVIEAFEDPFYESKMAGVVRACYESVALK